MIEVAFRDAAYHGTEQETMHFHACYEMLYVVKGWAEIRVARRDYSCHAPAVVFFGNLENHRIVAASEDYERYVLTLPPDRFREMPPMLLSLFRSRPAGFSHVLPLEECPFMIDRLFSALEEEIHRADAQSQLCAESLVQLLLANLYRFAPQAFPAGQREYPSSIIGAQRYLDEHFHEQVSVDEVAQRFYVSASYLRHSFQELIGLSPKQYIVLNRLAYARELLCTTGMPVAEIAEACGFSDVSNFIRRFRAHYGITPRAVRGKK